MTRAIELSQLGSALGVDESTGNVGIGTTNPWDKLVVYGGGIHLGIAPNSDNSARFTYNTLIGNLDISAHSTGGNTYTRFLTSLSGVVEERLRIDSAGNVGIGTTNPVAKLEVFSSGFAKIINNYNGTDFIKLNCGSSGGGITYNTGNYFVIQEQDYANRGTDTGYTERIRITSTGNVGINENNPTALLQVTNSSPDPFNTVLTTIKSTNSAGNGGAGTRIELVTGIATSWIQGLVDGGNSNSGSSIVFGTPSTGTVGTERLRIKNNSQLLHTRSDNVQRYDLEFRNTGGITDGNYGGIHWTQAADGSTNLAAIQIAYKTIGRPDMSFYLRQSAGTEITEVLRMTSTGNVGIGTTDPVDKLHVDSAGDFKLQLHSTNNNNVGLRLWSTKNWIIQSGPAAGNGVRFYDETSGGLGEVLRIDSSGRLHSGYNASSNAGTDQVNVVATGGGLQIARNQTGAPAVNEWLGAIGFQGYLSGNSTSSADARIHAKAAANHSGTSAGADLIFSTKPVTTGPGSAPADRMIITANGQITSGNLTISAYQFQDNAVGGYSQIQSDNHANTFFGQNFKLGASAGSGNHTLQVINQHSQIGGAGMYIGGNQNSSRQNAVTFYAVAANQTPGTDVTNMDRLRITPSNTFFWTQPTNYYDNAQTHLRTFGFTFNMADGEEEVMFYNPDSYRRIYYQIYIQAAHGSNGYGYILCNTSRYGTDFHDVDWHVSNTTYAHASSVNGNVNHNGVKLVRSGTYGLITYYVIVKAFSPAGGNPFSTSALTDASYRYYSQGF